MARIDPGLSPQAIQPSKMPNSLMLQPQRTSSIAVWRDLEYIYPTNQGTFSPTGGQNKIIIKIPNTKTFDFRNGYLQLTLATSGPGGGVTQWMAFGIWNIFKVLRICTPTILEEIRDYGKYVSFFNETQQPLGLTSLLGTAWGCVPLAQRQANGATSVTYYIPLASSFLMGSPLPARLFHEELQLELELAPPAECMESSAILTTQSYSLSNVQLWGESINAPDYDAMLATLIAGSGINFSFRTVDTFRSNPFSGTLYSWAIPQRAASVDGYYILMMDDGFDTNIQNVDKALTWHNGQDVNHQLISGQMRYGGRFYPQQPFDLTGLAPQMYLQYLKQCKLFIGYGLLPQKEGLPVLSIDQFTSSVAPRFFQYYDLNHLSQDGMVSRKSTTAYNVDTVIELKLNGSITNNQILFALIPYFRTVLLTQAGRFEVGK